MTTARIMAGRIAEALAASADPQRAPAMQAYMKSEMPFLGLARPRLTAKVRPLLAEQLSPTDWAVVAELLWDGARYREERYAALRVLRARVKLSASQEPLLRHLVVTGAWWDLVDEVATKLLGPLREEVDVRGWARDDDLWVRRAAIICQVGRGRDTDLALLSDVITANLGDRTFWIAKAIGWALRDCARNRPDWVRDFVAGTPDLVPLSVREATKHL